MAVLYKTFPAVAAKHILMEALLLGSRGKKLEQRYTETRQKKGILWSKASKTLEDFYNTNQSNTCIMQQKHEAYEFSSHMIQIIKFFSLFYSLSYSLKLAKAEKFLKASKTCRAVVTKHN